MKLSFETNYYEVVNSKLQLKQSNNGWYRFNWPGTNRTDFASAINFQNGVVKNFVTGEIISIKNFVVTYITKNLNDLKTTTLQINKPVNYTSTALEAMPPTVSLFDSSKLATRAKTYLQKRKFDIEKLDEKGFSVCIEPEVGDWFGRIIIPYLSGNKLVYFTGRDFFNNSERLKYRNPKTMEVGAKKSHYFYNETAIGKYDEIFLLEGALDAETLGENAIASSGWKLSPIQKTKIIEQVYRLVIVPDGGTLGDVTTPYKQALKLALELIFVIPEIIVINPCEFQTGKDLNEWGRENFLNVYRSYLPLSVADLSKLLDNEKPKFKYNFIRF